MEALFESLCKKVKLDRDKALAELLQLVSNNSTDFQFSALSNRLTLTLSNSKSSWESLAGCLDASCILLESKRVSSDDAQAFEEAAFGLLEHREFRVRMSAAQCIGKCCEFSGNSSVYQRRRGMIFDSIHTNLVRETEQQHIQLNAGSSTCSLDGETAEFSRGGYTEHERRSRSRSRSRSPSPSPPRSPSRAGMTKDEIFHDTAGWKSLETWMKCLEFTVCGCGSSFLAEVDVQLFELCDTSTQHVNRFVRESAYNVLAAVWLCERQLIEHSLGTSRPAAEPLTRRFGELVISQLHRGLCDNWSQVRLAASVASRHFLLSCDEQERELQVGRLIGPLCLNRYYAAEGVRTYAHETWRLATRGQGVQLVERYVQDVVTFYVTQTQADNHAVREAACVCLAELGAKIEHSVLRPYVHLMLTTLIDCFGDESWPVRDGACVACGNFVLAFPREAEPQLSTLVPLFLINLRDSIASVRQGAAVALANLLKQHAESSVTVLTKLLDASLAADYTALMNAQGRSDNPDAQTTQSLLLLLVNLMRQAFEGVKDQPTEAQRYTDVEKKPAVYGVIKRAHDNDVELHTDQTMYSCGSLAPRMGRKRRELCACEHALSRTFTRPSQAWEVADGGLLLLVELAQLEFPAARQAVLQLLVPAQKAIAHRHYAMHVALLETFCKVLPRLATGLTLRMFKSYFELFVHDLFYAARCENRLTESAAADCLLALSKMMGRQILCGRIQQTPFASRYLEILEKCLATVDPTAIKTPGTSTSHL